MLTKCKGIVLRSTRYGETSVIVSAFTDTDGLQTFLVKGARRPQKQSKMAFFQPLTILDLVVYRRPQAQMHHLREIKCLFPYRRIPGDIRRETIALFLTDVLQRTLKEQSNTEDLFKFLESWLLKLDSDTEGLEHFHLRFMLELGRQLGFGAGSAYDITSGHRCPIAAEAALEDLLKGGGGQMSSEIRRELLVVILDYLRRHVDNFGQLKSLDVLREVLH